MLTFQVIQKERSFVKCAQMSLNIHMLTKEVSLYRRKEFSVISTMYCYSRTIDILIDLFLWRPCPSPWNEEAYTHGQDRVPPLPLRGLLLPITFLQDLKLRNCYSRDPFPSPLSHSVSTTQIMIALSGHNSLACHLCFLVSTLLV